MITSSEREKVMDKLLELYDWQVRITQQSDGDDSYAAGYADALGQCILDIGKVLGETKAPYKYEAFKRVMEYTNTADYWKKYPKPIASYFPPEIIRKNGGQL